ncbi:MAG TPA: hypothetical protein DCR16_03340 [Lachnospiraceae bacterium]|nr:hypothetical protein [Lachnospiraceae bacterium]
MSPRGRPCFAGLRQVAFSFRILYNDKNCRGRAGCFCREGGLSQGFHRERAGRLAAAGKGKESSDALAEKDH